MKAEKIASISITFMQIWVVASVVTSLVSGRILRAGSKRPIDPAIPDRCRLRPPA